MGRFFGDQKFDPVAFLNRSANSNASRDDEIVKPGAIIPCRQYSYLFKLPRDVIRGIAASNGACQAPFAEVVCEPANMFHRFAARDGASGVLYIGREACAPVSPTTRGYPLSLDEWCQQYWNENPEYQHPDGSSQENDAGITMSVEDSGACKWCQDDYLSLYTMRPLVRSYGEI